MTKWIGVAAVSLCLVCAGCGKDPRKFQITEANQDKLLEEMKDMKGLTVEEGRLLMGYVMRSKMGEAMKAAGLAKSA